MKYLVLICARAGSKGLPGKNIKTLEGIPLIGWSINTAKALDNVTRIIVSTDSAEIAKIANEYGAETPFLRPNYLAQDNSPEWLVWRHAINYMEEIEAEIINAVIVLPVTAPLRSVVDVNACINLFEMSQCDSIITVSEANRNPYFNMTVNDQHGYTSLVIPPKKRVIRRQDAPRVYDMTTVAYVVNANLIKDSDGVFDGKVKSVLVPRERAIDIDNIMDFKIAESLLKHQKEPLT